MEGVGKVAGGADEVASAFSGVVAFSASIRSALAERLDLVGIGGGGF